MSDIWTELYGDFLVKQTRNDGEHGDFDSVEAKVQELQKRVGLAAVVNQRAASDDLTSTAADAQTDVILATEIMPHLMALKHTRPLADPYGIIRSLIEKLPQHRDLIISAEDYLLQRAGISEHTVAPKIEVPEQAKESEDNDIWPSISDKIKR